MDRNSRRDGGSPQTTLPDNASSGKRQAQEGLSSLVAWLPRTEEAFDKDLVSLEE
jgi:hypothetical protein